MSVVQAYRGLCGEADPALGGVARLSDENDRMCAGGKRRGAEHTENDGITCIGIHRPDFKAVLLGGGIAKGPTLLSDAFLIRERRSGENATSTLNNPEVHDLAGDGTVVSVDDLYS
jgi:hypothetical protein